jgi:hypothetical protein
MMEVLIIYQEHQSTGNRKTWTFHVWIKRSQLRTNQKL